MGIILKIRSWWKGMTVEERISSVFRGVTATAAVGGAIYCASTMKKDKRLIENAVSAIGDKVDVEVSQDLIDMAVARAVEKQVKNAVNTVVRQNWTDIQDLTKDSVNKAVVKNQDKIESAVAERMAKELDKVDRDELVNDIKDKAKDALVEKLDSKLDDITDTYSQNLDSMSKIYNSLADKLASKS